VEKKKIHPLLAALNKDLNTTDDDLISFINAFQLSMFSRRFKCCFYYAQNLCVVLFALRKQRYFVCFMLNSNQNDGKVNSKDKLFSKI